MYNLLGKWSIVHRGFSPTRYWTRWPRSNNAYKHMPNFQCVKHLRPFLFLLSFHFPPLFTPFFASSHHYYVLSLKKSGEWGGGQGRENNITGQKLYEGTFFPSENDDCTKCYGGFCWIFWAHLPSLQPCWWLAQNCELERLRSCSWGFQIPCLSQYIYIYFF